MNVDFIKFPLSPKSTQHGKRSSEISFFSGFFKSHREFARSFKYHSYDSAPLSSRAKKCK